MIQIAVYAVIAIALLGMIGTGVYKVKEWGADEVRLEWREEAAKSVKISEAHRKRQEAVRDKVDKEATRRINDVRARSQTLMASLEAHIKAARLPAECRLTPELLGDANAALAGSQGERPGTVPRQPPPPTPTR